MGMGIGDQNWKRTLGYQSRCWESLPNQHGSLLWNPSHRNWNMGLGWMGGFHQVMRRMSRLLFASLFQLFWNKFHHHQKVHRTDSR